MIHHIRSSFFPLFHLIRSRRKSGGHLNSRELPCAAQSIHCGRFLPKVLWHGPRPLRTLCPACSCKIYFRSAVRIKRKRLTTLSMVENGSVNSFLPSLFLHNQTAPFLHSQVSTQWPFNSIWKQLLSFNQIKDSISTQNYLLS